MCPQCGSTNTINANEELYNWKPHRLAVTGTSSTIQGSELSYAELEQHANYLVSIGVIKSFLIHRRRNHSSKHILYDTTNYKTDIIAQALKQDIFITYEEQTKPLNKRVPKLPLSAPEQCPKKPSLTNKLLEHQSDLLEVLGLRKPFEIIDDGERQNRAAFCKAEPSQDETPVKIFDSPETRDNQLNKKAKPKTRKQTYEGWNYESK
jgi:hypothetical protein